MASIGGAALLVSAVIAGGSVLSHRGGPAVADASQGSTTGPPITIREENGETLAPLLDQDLDPVSPTRIGASAAYSLAESRMAHQPGGGPVGDDTLIPAGEHVTIGYLTDPVGPAPSDGLVVDHVLVYAYQSNVCLLGLGVPDSVTPPPTPSKCTDWLFLDAATANSLGHLYLSS